MIDQTIPAPLNPYARMSDDDWPGKLLDLGPDTRLVVNAPGTRYALQKRLPADSEGGFAWGGTSYAKLTSLLAKQAGLIDGLAQACADLPDDPALARPELVQAKANLRQVYDATDWRKPDYACIWIRKIFRTR